MCVDCLVTDALRTPWQTNCDRWLTVFWMQRIKYEYDPIEYVRNPNAQYLIWHFNASKQSVRRHLSNIEWVSLSQSNEENKCKIKMKTATTFRLSVEMKNLLRFLPSTSVSSCFISSPMTNLPRVRFPQKSSNPNSVPTKTNIGLYTSR